MGETRSKIDSDRQPQAHSGLSALARIGWMVVGSIMMVSLAMSIASQPAWSFTSRDLVFWGVALATGIVRYIDVTKLDGQTANGDRATTKDLRQYLISLVAIACLLWVGAQSVWL
jgi:hypothetical protein